MAYEVEPAARAEVLATLDHREQGGYARHEATVFGSEDVVVAEAALVYVATPENENYLGPAPLDAIARQVIASTGPSGPNDEYVLALDRALRELGADDAHVRELAEAVRCLLPGGPA